MKRYALAALMLAVCASGAYADPSVQSVSVPDSGTTMALMTGAMLGLGLLRRYTRR